MSRHQFADFGVLGGRVNDLDSHLETPISQWGELLGPSWGAEAAGFIPIAGWDEARASEFRPSDFWEIKHSGAPGMFDLDDRIRILDTVGIHRQLVFPALMMMFRMWAAAPGRDERLAAYNALAGRWTRQSEGRVVVAATVAGDLRAVLAQTEAALAGGARALFIRDGVAIEHRSPADPQMDPLWAMLVEAGACLVLHVGGSGDFVGNDWKVTPTLDVDPGADNLADRLAGPHNIGTMHLAPSNYLTCLIFGGVFDRHPSLRVGVVEYGAMWAGPLMDLLDNRGRQSERVQALQRTPGEIFSQNLRFTPFGFESVAHQIDRYGVPEMYCFSTDFPHPEGLTDPHERFHDDMARRGDALREQFFVTNAELLLPD